MVKVLVLKILACRPMFYTAVSHSSQMAKQGSYTYKDDQFHQTFATHKSTNGERFAPDDTAETSSKSCADDLTEECGEGNSKDISPGDAVVEQPQICLQTGQGEIKWQEKSTDHILKLLSDFEGKSIVTRNNQTNHKSTEDGVDSNDTGEEGRGKSDEENESNDTL